MCRRLKCTFDWFLPGDENIAGEHLREFTENFNLVHDDPNSQNTYFKTNTNIRTKVDFFVLDP